MCDYIETISGSGNSRITDSKRTSALECSRKGKEVSKAGVADARGKGVGDELREVGEGVHSSGSILALL